MVLAIVGLALLATAARAVTSCEECDKISTECVSKGGDGPVCACKPGFARGNLEALEQDPPSYEHIRLRLSDEQDIPSWAMHLVVEHSASPEWVIPRPNATHCWDVNECADASKCGDMCTNSPGSFNCGCKVGTKVGSYDPHTKQLVCVDLDECSEDGGNTHSDCAISATCVNIDAMAEDLPVHPMSGFSVGYRCECRDGTVPHPVLLGYSPSGCIPPGAVPGPIITHSGLHIPNASIFDHPDGGNNAPKTVEEYHTHLREIEAAETQRDEL
jgi:hypothetical protein